MYSKGIKNEGETIVEYNTLDERINSLEFQQALEEKDFKELNDIFNNTPSENTLADTGRFPD